MQYKYSQIDKRNLNWFKADSSIGTLLEISLSEGTIRGLSPFTISMNYPISAIAGRNGSGKSTILAMAACAFHNEKDGFKRLRRKFPYYTFADFFIQTEDEIYPEGIKIRFQILYNKWKKSKKFPDGIGAGYQVRKKRQGGKWNDYSLRLNRNVVFFGINRIVPHSENPTIRTYRRAFKASEEHGWESFSKDSVERVLNKSYSSFCYKVHNQYRIPLVNCDSFSYSGFNMGAGENAVIELFSTIYSAPTGLFLVIDEIELGLHPEAQIRLIEELKIVCEKRKIQILCTTHSSSILSSLPPEGRFFVEKIENQVIITPAISPQFAAGKLSGENSNEIDIYVEDDFAKLFLESCIENEIRKRVNILPIGSAEALIFQLAARYKEIKKGEALVIFDGDQITKTKTLESHFFKAIEKHIDKNAVENWFKNHIEFFPGRCWPEKWLLERSMEGDLNEPEKWFQTKNGELKDIILRGLKAGKHYEFYSISKELNLDLEFVIRCFSHYVFEKNFQYFEEILMNIKNKLK